MENATRIAFPCYPYNWIEVGETNVASLRSPGNFYANLLAPTLAELNQSIEIVYASSDADPNITSLSEIQTLYEGKADLAFDNYFYRHDRQQVISYLYPVRVSFNASTKTNYRYQQNLMLDVKYTAGHYQEND